MHVRAREHVCAFVCVCVCIRAAAKNAIVFSRLVFSLESCVRMNGDADKICLLNNLAFVERELAAYLYLIVCGILFPLRMYSIFNRTS